MSEYVTLTEKFVRDTGITEEEKKRLEKDLGEIGLKMHRSGKEAQENGATTSQRRRSKEKPIEAVVKEAWEYWCSRSQEEELTGGISVNEMEDEIKQTKLNPAALEIAACVKNFYGAEQDTKSAHRALNRKNTLHSYNIGMWWKCKMDELGGGNTQREQERRSALKQLTNEVDKLRKITRDKINLPSTPGALDGYKKLVTLEENEITNWLLYSGIPPSLLYKKTIKDLHTICVELRREKGLNVPEDSSSSNEYRREEDDGKDGKDQDEDAAIPIVQNQVPNERDRQRDIDAHVVLRNEEPDVDRGESEPSPATLYESPIERRSDGGQEAVEIRKVADMQINHDRSGLQDEDHDKQDGSEQTPDALQSRKNVEVSPRHHDDDGRGPGQEHVLEHPHNQEDIANKNQTNDGDIEKENVLDDSVIHPVHESNQSPHHDSGIGQPVYKSSDQAAGPSAIEQPTHGSSDPLHRHESGNPRPSLLPNIRRKKGHVINQNDNPGRDIRTMFRKNRDESRDTENESPSDGSIRSTDKGNRPAHDIASLEEPGSAMELECDPQDAVATQKRQRDQRRAGKRKKSKKKKKKCAPA